MCDTWVALKDTTFDGNVIFAKNSDRPIFDCQPLHLKLSERWQRGSRLKTTYVELPQAEYTYAHLGSSPYWCWGYEEGINEWSLVIGNEAVYTKAFRSAVVAFREGRETRLGLLGMDLIRLGLERCKSASQAVELIGSLVEEYGQFGSGNPGKSHAEGSYDNAFLIADPQGAWVLETAGRRWAATRLTQGSYSISNELSIRTKWDLGSPDLLEYAQKNGWWPGEQGQGFDFARAYIDENVPRQISHIRAMRSRQLLEQKRGQATPAWMMRIARDHYEDTFLKGPYFDPADPDFLSLCMHVSPADFTWGNTASSCVAVLPKAEGELPVFWWTPGPPCTGCYIPFFPHGSRLPEIVSRTGALGRQVFPADQVGEDSFDLGSYWWLFRRLMDTVKGDPLRSVPGCYHARQPQVRARFDGLEHEFYAQIPEVTERAAARRTSDPAGMAAILDEFSATCVEKVIAAMEELRTNL